MPLARFAQLQPPAGAQDAVHLAQRLRPLAALQCRDEQPLVNEVEAAGPCAGETGNGVDGERDVAGCVGWEETALDVGAVQDRRGRELRGGIAEPNS